MHFTIPSDSSESILSLSGELTLLQAGQLKVQLIQALTEVYERVHIDIEAVTGIDLACLQMLCAAYRSAVSLGKQLVLFPQVPEAIATTVDQAGMMQCHACGDVGENACLWNGGER